MNAHKNMWADRQSLAYSTETYGDIMKKNIVTCLCMLTLCYALLACASNHGQPIQVKPNLTTVSRGDDIPVELPANYSQKNYKRLIVGVYFEPDGAAAYYDDLPLATVAMSLETEISKLKRFTIVSRQGGQKAIEAEKKFKNKGMAKTASQMQYGRTLDANFVLYCGISAVREEYERVDHNEFLYIVRLDYQLIDVQTGEIIEADYAEGRAKRTFVRLPSGRFLGGFDYRSGELDPVNQAALNALKIVGHRLGNALPLGGHVLAMRGDRIQIDKGVSEGFMGKQVVVVYTNDFGMDVPIALAELTPSDHTAVGRIFKWSDEPEAEELVEELQSDPTFVLRNDVFVVSIGMPLPPEWERNYDDE